MASDDNGVSGEEIAVARRRLRETREKIRNALADELGGDPEEYDADRSFRNLGSSADRGSAESE